MQLNLSPSSDVAFPNLNANWVVQIRELRLSTDSKNILIFPLLLCSDLKTWARTTVEITPSKEKWCRVGHCWKLSASNVSHTHLHKPDWGKTAIKLSGGASQFESQSESRYLLIWSDDKWSTLIKITPLSISLIFGAVWRKQFHSYSYFQKQYLVLFFHLK